MQVTDLSEMICGQVAQMNQLAGFGLAVMERVVDVKIRGCV